MRLVRGAGDQTGVEVRRFTPLAVANKEFYTELSFEIEIDGNWHNVMQFFDRVGNLPRLANVSNIGIGPLGSPVKGVKKKYDYGPTETIAAACTVTTFYRRADQGKPGAAAPKK
jgi:type IV pilus assembly protein PilO